MRIHRGGPIMRGSDERSGALFSYVDLEARVRSDHPLRTIRRLANAALGDLSGDFDEVYTAFGRPSIAPEKLLGDAAAGVLRHPLGAAVDGAAGLRSAVPLVRRPGRGRRGVGSLDLLQEPRPAIYPRCGALAVKYP
uniref:ISGsu3, transposase n=1 Tax=Rhodopseudomonas palustris (strain BisA53) TaxID=316055 RepID=Q07TT6_RHOP5